jgi:molybdopterin molybdotransferase
MTLLAVDEARDQLLSSVKPKGVTRVSLEAALGRVLAQDILSSCALPPFDQSMMDGYAVRTSDLDGEPPWVLKVSGESRPGAPQIRALEAGTASRIFTGAVLPADADAVVIQEQAVRQTDRVSFEHRPDRFEHVRRTGEDLALGASALAAGSRLGPPQLALLGALDLLEVLVRQQPRVTVFATGDELRAPGYPPRPGSVVDINSPLVTQLCRSVGAEVVRVTRLADDLDATRIALETALQDSDLVLTLGGVSVGDYDFVRTAASAAGVTLDFWRVAMKPGKPLLVGHRGAGRLLGIPGNPLSTLVVFMVFVAPLLRALQGDSCPLSARAGAELVAPITRTPGRREWVPVALHGSGRAALRAAALRHWTSGSVTALAWAHGFVEVDADATHVPAGTVLPLWRLCDV